MLDPTPLPSLTAPLAAQWTFARYQGAYRPACWRDQAPPGKRGHILSNLSTTLKQQSISLMESRKTLLHISWPTWMAAISLSLFGPLQKSATVLGVPLSSARMKVLHCYGFHEGYKFDYTPPICFLLQKSADLSSWSVGCSSWSTSTLSVIWDQIQSVSHLHCFILDIT